jgi:hypothetical protein
LRGSKRCNLLDVRRAADAPVRLRRDDYFSLCRSLKGYLIGAHCVFDLKFIVRVEGVKGVMSISVLKWSVLDSSGAYDQQAMWETENN